MATLKESYNELKNKAKYPIKGRFIDTENDLEIDNYTDKKGQEYYKVDGKKMDPDTFMDEYGDKVKLSLNVIKAAAFVDDDDVLDAIDKLSTPQEDRDSASEIFTEYLGYDPTDYYDKTEIRKLLVTSKFVTSTSWSEQKTTAVVDRALELYENDRTYGHAIALKKAIMEIDDTDQKLIDHINSFISAKTVEIEDESEEVNLSDLINSYNEDEDNYTVSVDDDDDEDFDDDYDF